MSVACSPGASCLLILSKRYEGMPISIVDSSVEMNFSFYMIVFLSACMQLYPYIVSVLLPETFARLIEQHLAIKRAKVSGNKTETMYG